MRKINDPAPGMIPPIVPVENEVKSREIKEYMADIVVIRIDANEIMIASVLVKFK